MITPVIRKSLPLLVIAFILFPLSILFAMHLLTPNDDAYILFVYAKNFLNGNGWTYNGTRVEGFSTTLWLGILTLFGFSRIPLPALAQGLSMFSGLLCLAATYFLGRRMTLEPSRAVLPCCLVAASGDFAFYMGSGMEQILFTALVAWCIALTFSEDRVALLRSIHYPLALAAMILTRPEGVLITALILIWMVIETRSLLPAIRCGLVLTCILLPILVAKWWYYGSWLPNTYYIKGNAGLANWGIGREYVRYAYRRHDWFILAVALFFVLSLIKREKDTLRRVIPLLIISGVWILQVVMQGGDNMVGRRVLLPILPLICVSIIACTRFIRVSFSVVLTFALSAFLVHTYLTDWPILGHLEGWRSHYQIRRKYGLYLRNHFPANTVVALNPAGIIPFYSELPTIDMLGLNDSYIAHYGKRNRKLDYAHQAGDGAYVLSRKPDVILLSGRLMRAVSSHTVGDIEIWSSKQFHEEYELQFWKGVGYAYVRKKTN